MAGSETVASAGVPNSAGQGRYLTVIFLTALARWTVPPPRRGVYLLPRRASRPEFPCSLLWASKPRFGSPGHEMPASWLAATRERL